MGTNMKYFSSRKMDRLQIALVFVALLYLSSSRISATPLEKTHSVREGAESCKQGCTTIDPDKINVHLIPHSHDDVGWLKTVEEYYYGKHDEIQNVGVQYIIDSVLQALKRDPRRRFIQVETAFFWKWWKYQSEEKRNLFKSFVDNGQIEMVGGGWSMNDEACTNYQSTINQFTWGLRLLNDTLGECGRPKIGWQIDPFGHSREQASIFKQMGYDAFFFVRLSKSTKDELKLDTNLEFMWKSSGSLNNSEIFTSIFSTDSYFAPNNFCWDYLQCSSDAINDDPESFDYNLERKVDEFSEYIANFSAYFKTNNILLAMGGDFQYQAAERNYINLDRLIKGFRGNAKYNVFYSTPSCYYQAVTQSNPNLITISDDFFPYAENDHAYWTGYYTSRPTTKRFERIGNNILQASQQLNAFANMKNDNKSIDYNENLTSLREVMGTMQHHDAITGTEKEKVALDYVRLLTKAIRETEEPMGQIIGDLLRKENVTERITLPISTCLLTNISICDDSLKDRFMVTVYNPLSRYVTYYVRLPSYNSTYNITGPDGEETYDIVPHMYYSVNSTSQASEAELVFAARNIPPLGIKYYYVQKLNDKVNGVEVADNKTFGSSGVSFTLDDNNLLQSVTMNNRTVSINQKFLAYISNNGTGDSIASGAYLFRPLNGTDAYHIDYIFGKDNVNETTQNRVKVSYTRGNLVDEVIQVFNDWLTQTIRVYKEPDNNYIEFDWIVGPLDNDTVDTEYNHGKEVITRFLVSDVDHEDFYTDSNGREMITRKRKHYPYGNSSFEPVTSNYYPVTSKISIEDKSKDIRVAVLNDRSQGGSSLWGGEIELMIHRRLLRDDYKGVDESLQEMEFGKYLVVRGQHYLVIGSATTGQKDSDIKSTATQERELALKKLLQPLVLVGDAREEAWSLENIQSKINFEWSGLKAALPDNVNILNLEPWKDGSYLLRLEHILAKDEDMNYSKEVSVNVSDIFAPHSISSIRETTLAANDWLSPSDTASLDDFKSKNDDDDATPSIPRYLNENGTQISLTPMQIRTFVVEVSN